MGWLWTEKVRLLPHRWQTQVEQLRRAADHLEACRRTPEDSAAIGALEAFVREAGSAVQADGSHLLPRTVHLYFELAERLVLGGRLYEECWLRYGISDARRAADFSDIEVKLREPHGSLAEVPPSVQLLIAMINSPFVRSRFECERQRLLVSKGC